jgi:hypothetical protein
VSDATLTHDELERYLEGELTVSRTKEVEAQLASDPLSAARLEEVTALREQMADAPAELFDVDLAATVEGALERGEQPRARRSRTPFVAAGAAVLALAASVVILVQPPDDSRAKSGGGARADRWAGIVAHGPDGARVQEGFARDDALGFSFTNAGPRPYSHLAVFAVDERGAVFWYYPAWLRAEDNPRSILAKAGTEVPLPEKVKHAFEPGPLVVYGLFTREPVSVRDVEAHVKAWVEGGRWSTLSPPRFELGDTAQHTLSLKVRP